MIQKTITDRLGEETKEYHARLEVLPYFGALIDHQLPLECYVSQIRALAVVHGVMETTIAASTDERAAGREKIIPESVAMKLAV